MVRGYTKWSAPEGAKIPISSEVVDSTACNRAATTGYFIPDDEAAVEAKASDEHVELFGDADKLSESQRTALLRLKEASVYTRIKVKRIALSFSGASVFFFSPIRTDGSPMPSSVLKLDTEDNVRDEVTKTEHYAPLFGLTTPKVKDTVYLGADPEDPSAVMQIDLCGGVFGLPEFASAPSVLTFATVIQQEMDAKERTIDVVPYVNEALERRMYGFTMSSRCVKKVDLAKMYKIVRFVGHGVLNREKEGKKRAQKSPALGAGFLNPVDIDDLDPQGIFLQELAGTRKSIKDFFKEFVAHESAFGAKFERESVLGLCHNDLHGGNLLLDSQGLVWLIDFATVKDSIHVLMDLAKFLASCLFLYLGDNITESYVQSIAKLLAATPDATTALPDTGGEDLQNEPVALFLMDLLTRLRHCMCIYEIGDDAPTNDGVPFAIAFFSWSARMLSYSEPSLHQKTRALYCSLVGAQRLLWEIGVDVGPTALKWLEQFQQLWEGQKGRRLSTSAVQLQVTTYSFEAEFPRFLAQLGTSEAWSTDFLTREKVHVTDHCISVEVKHSMSIQTRNMATASSTVLMLKKLESIHKDYLPAVLETERFCGRLMIIGDSGSGKTMLTRQLFSEVSQRQLTDIYKEGPDTETTAVRTDVRIVPLRLPLVDLSRQLEADPNASLEANPINDLLSQWVQRRYGEDSVPFKLVSDSRHACLSTKRRNSVGALSIGSETPVDAAASLENIAEPSANSEVTGLMLLFDGYDEASTFKPSILAFITSLLRSEDVHICVFTSRPESIGMTELASFTQLGFVSFAMGKLSAKQAEQLTVSTLQRLQDSQTIIDSVARDMLEPAYEQLRCNPMILTLLIHVLRKQHAVQLSSSDAKMSAEQVQKQHLMRKTEVYQRAVKLMLHQSDAAKFMMREGKSDQAMVQRLEMLKSARARKLLQALSWHAHGMQTRALTWKNIEEVCDDIEMVHVLHKAFAEGRFSLLEPLPTSGTEPMVQMTHLSFQELMSSEFAAAIARQSHAEHSLRAYVNYFLSTNPKTLDRDKLSSLWWLKVWFSLCEMLSPTVFADFAATLAEDERVQLQVGTHVYCSIVSPLKFLVQKNWEEIPVNIPWQFGHTLRTTSLNYDDHTAYVTEVGDTCGSLNLRVIGDVGLRPWGFSSLKFPAEGVAHVLRHAARSGEQELIRLLIKNKVHYACQDQDVMFALQIAWQYKQEESAKTLINLGCAMTHLWTGTPMSSENSSECQAWNPDGLERFAGTAAKNELRCMRPYGILEEAYNGTLKIASDVDINFSDKNTLMTPLMLAAAAGRDKLVHDLIAARANVHAESREGCTALTFAAESKLARGQNGTQCLKHLIDAKANVNHCAGKSHTKYHMYQAGARAPAGNMVCFYEDYDKLDILVKSGYDLNLGSDACITPVFWACCSGSIKMIKRLVDLKADLHGRIANRSKERLPWYWKFTCVPELWNWTVHEHNGRFGHSFEIMKYLIEERGFDVNKIGGGAQFHSFAKFARVDRLVLEVNYNPAIRDEQDYRGVKYLLDSKIDLYKKFAPGVTEVTTAWSLMHCKSGGVLELCFEHKLDPTIKHGNYGTLQDKCPIHHADVFMDTYEDYLRMQSDDQCEVMFFTRRS